MTTIIEPDDVELKREIENFYRVAEEAKADFGKWDALDPVAEGIVRIVRAQNSLARAIEEVECYGEDARLVEEAIAERIEAIAALQEAIKEEPRGYQ